MRIEGTLVEMGDLEGLTTPGLRIEVGDHQLVEVVGLTREQIKAMPAVMFRKIVVTFAEPEPQA